MPNQGVISDDCCRWTGSSPQLLGHVDGLSTTFSRAFSLASSQRHVLEVEMTTEASWISLQTHVLTIGCPAHRRERPRRWAPRVRSASARCSRAWRRAPWTAAPLQASCAPLPRSCPRLSSLSPAPMVRFRLIMFCLALPSHACYLFALAPALKPLPSKATAVQIPCTPCMSG